MKKLLWRISDFIKKHKKLSILVTALIGGIFVFLIIPHIIQWIMTKPSPFPNPNIANNDWIGFWGGYLGALVGAGVVLLAIRADNKRWKEQKRGEYEPFFNVFELKGKDESIDTMSMKINLLEDKDDKNFKEMRFFIGIKNISRAYALNVSFLIQAKGKPFYRDEMSSEINVFKPEDLYSILVTIKYKESEILEKFTDKHQHMQAIFNEYTLRLCYDSSNDWKDKSEHTMSTFQHNQQGGKINYYDYNILEMIRRNDDMSIEFFHSISYRKINLVLNNDRQKRGPSLIKKKS